METNATLAVPGEGGSLELFASTQNPTGTQDVCAKVCGVDRNKVRENRGDVIGFTPPSKAGT